MPQQKPSPFLLKKAKQLFPGEAEKQDCPHSALLGRPATAAFCPQPCLPGLTASSPRDSGACMPLVESEFEPGEAALREPPPSGVGGTLGKSSSEVVDHP